jgi:hypothetical protein
MTERTERKLTPLQQSLIGECFDHTKWQQPTSPLILLYGFDAIMMAIFYNSREAVGDLEAMIADQRGWADEQSQLDDNEAYHRAWIELAEHALAIAKRRSAH